MMTNLYNDVYMTAYIYIYAEERLYRKWLADFVFAGAIQGNAFCDLPEDTMLPGEM